ncbi:hypothetical protein [Lactococcus cremoris]
MALAYKLQAMSNLALSFQRKFQSALNRRYSLWSSLEYQCFKQRRLERY